MMTTLFKIKVFNYSLRLNLAIAIVKMANSTVSESKKKPQASKQIWNKELWNRQTNKYETKNKQIKTNRQELAGDNSRPHQNAELGQGGDELFALCVLLRICCHAGAKVIGFFIFQFPFQDSWGEAGWVVRHQEGFWQHHGSCFSWAKNHTKIKLISQSQIFFGPLL